MNKALIVALIALPLTASAQETAVLGDHYLPPPSWGSVPSLSFGDQINGIASTKVNVYDLYITDGAGSTNKMFTLSPGGCIRGPLRFFDTKGNKILSLENGKEIGSGCASYSVAPPLRPEK